MIEVITKLMHLSLFYFERQTLGQFGNKSYLHNVHSIIVVDGLSPIETQPV